MAKPEQISSPNNPLLKDVRRAIGRGTLTSEGLLVAETFHLLEEALRSELEVRLVLAAAGVLSAVESHVRGLRGVRVAVVPDIMFPQLGSLDSPQGVISLVRPPEWKLENVFGGKPLVVALDGVQDPGNAGAIVRAAEAFGASGVLFLKGTVSPYNPKTVRASAGSLFRQPFLAGLDPELAKAAFQQRKMRLYAADPLGEMALARADLRPPTVLVIGSEAHGVGHTLRQGSRKLRIPTQGVESLNAALAAAVLLYEALRQRSSS